MSVCVEPSLTVEVLEHPEKLGYVAITIVQMKDGGFRNVGVNVSYRVQGVYASAGG